MGNALTIYHGNFGRATIYELNRPMSTHAHREGHLIFHIQGPGSRMDVSAKSHDVNLSSAIAINPWDPHSFHPGNLGTGTVLLVLYINPIWFLETNISVLGPFRFGKETIEVTQHIGAMVRRVSSRLLNGDVTDLLEGYIYELTQECFIASRTSQTEKPLIGAGLSGMLDNRIRRSIFLMKKRVSDELVLDKIAKDSGLSRPHFYKLFREQIGLTPNVYLNTLRMETAIDMLTTTSEAVTSIGLDLGFSSQASFTRFFTANVGVPPTNYRIVTQLSSKFVHFQ